MHRERIRPGQFACRPPCQSREQRCRPGRGRQHRHRDHQSHRFRLRSASPRCH
uniref:Uncharacterized protein n=1 Tax=uncultured marine virus TaxID=186617 RepID=A0A0F7L2X7_9VIRU|nr:hypothetical protein [uncultured marine virus]